jgi:hypothetical protein
VPEVSERPHMLSAVGDTQKLLLDYYLTSIASVCFDFSYCGRLLRQIVVMRLIPFVRLHIGSIAALSRLSCLISGNG